MGDMKLIMESWRQYRLQEAPYVDQLAASEIEDTVKQAADTATAAQAQGETIGLQTVGDLKNLVAKAKHAKKVGNMKDASIAAMKGIAFGRLGAIKDLGDLAKASYHLPDDKQYGPGLKALNVDDEVSAIVDDQLENAFLKILDRELSTGSIPDDTPLAKLDMTQMLSNYIAKTHDKRTVKKPEES